MNSRTLTVTLNPAVDWTLNIPLFEAGAVNRVAGQQQHAGGKGVNVALVLSALGAQGAATGFIGEENADVFDSALDRAGIENRFIRLPGRTRVGIKIVDDASSQTTDINFAGLAPSPEALEELSAVISAAGPALVVLSGSVPAGCRGDIYAKLVETVKAAGGWCAVDTSGLPLQLALEAAPNLIKPNRDEIAQLLGPLEDVAAIVRAARTTILSRGVERVVVSMGSAGAVSVDAQTALLARPPRVKLVSSVGAGDAMLAGLVYARQQDWPADRALRFSTALGADAVTRIGAGGFDRAAIERLAQQVEIENV